MPVTTTIKALPLTEQMLRERLKDHVYLMYLNFSFFIKGAVVVVGGAAIYFILSTSGNDFKLQQVALWITSFSFSLVTIATWSRGSAFTNARANPWDIVLPIALGMCEGLLFAVLAPSKDAPQVWVFWYLVYGLFATCAAGLVLNRLNQAHPLNYAADLRAKVKDYRKWLFEDIEGACGTAVLGFTAFIFCQCFPFLQEPSAWPYHVAVGFFLTAVAIKLIKQSSSQYEELTELEIKKDRPENGAVAGLAIRPSERQ